MNKEILRLAIPNIISNISVPLLSAVDTALMGHISMLHLGAIGLSGMIFNFLYWNFGFLRMGTTGMVAQAYGRNDQDSMRDLLVKSLLISLSVGFVLFVSGSCLLEASIGLLQISVEVQPFVSDYFDILIYGAPAILVLFVLYGWLFGMQDARTPLYVTVIVNLINVGISYYLVEYQQMGIAGAAYGTLIAQYMGVLILLPYIIYRYSWLRTFSIKGQSDWLAFARINADLFIRTVALTFAFGFFYRQSSQEGTLILAVNVVLLQFLTWMSYGIDGFAYSAESLVGKYYGAKNTPMLIKAMKYSFIWGGLLACLFSIMFGFMFEEIALIFSKDIEVMNTLKAYRWLIAWLPLVAFVCYVWDGILIGLTESHVMRDTMLLSLLIYVGSFLIFWDFEENAIWISFVLFLVIRGVFQTLYWKWEVAEKVRFQT